MFHRTTLRLCLSHGLARVDGSVAETGSGRAGASICLNEIEIHGISEACGKFCSSCTAELRAIKLALHKIYEDKEEAYMKLSRGKHLRICTDSQAAIQILQTANCETTTEVDIWKLILIIRKELKMSITFQFVC